MTMVGDTGVNTAPIVEEHKTNAFDNMETDTPVPVTEEAKETVDKARLPGVASGSTTNKGVINQEKYEAEELVITSEEKAAFVNAMLTGERYFQTYAIFGDKISLKVRSRTTKETQAMYAYIRHELSEDGGNLSLLEGDMQYLLLLAQVEEINGTKYPEMKGPLTFVDSDGKTQPPGWIDDLVAWKNKPEGLVSAIINRIQLFEYKYWTMVKEASNKNFWKSDTSTAD